MDDDVEALVRSSSSSSSLLQRRVSKYGALFNLVNGDLGLFIVG